MRYLVLDIETLSIANAADFLPLSEIEPDGRLKDPEKIAADIAAKQQAIISKAALDLDLARVCAVAYMQHGADTEPHVLASPNATHEEENLRHIADSIEGYRGVTTLVTFNGHKFDLPLLMRRARYLNIGFPRLNLDRYKSPHVDLYEELTMRGSLKAHGLRWYMRRLGWTDLLEADPLKDGGADVATAAAEGRWDDIAAHVRVDVLGTYRLAVWLGVIPPAVEAAAGF